MIEVIKQAALEAVLQSQPCDMCFGTVTQTKPLIIEPDGKKPLSEAFLVLTRNVTEHYIEMTIEHETENDDFMDGKHTHICASCGNTEEGDLDVTHRHEYKGRKKWLIHKGLTDGERVLLIRMQGGQRFVVVDRLA